MAVRIVGSPADTMAAMVALILVVQATRGVAVGGSGTSSVGRRPDLDLGSGYVALALGPRGDTGGVPSKNSVLLRRRRRRSRALLSS